MLLLLQYKPILEDNTKATMVPVFLGVAHPFTLSFGTNRREDQGFCLFVVPHLKLPVMSSSSVISRLRWSNNKHLALLTLAPLWIWFRAVIFCHPACIICYNWTIILMFHFIPIGLLRNCLALMYPMMTSLNVKEKKKTDLVKITHLALFNFTPVRLKHPIKFQNWAAHAENDDCLNCNRVSNDVTIVHTGCVYYDRSAHM